MRKIISTVIATVMLVSLSAVSIFSSVFAGVAEAGFTPLYSFTLADTDLGYELRGFTASQDGKYLYAGFLQNTRNVEKIDASNGKFLDTYTPVISEINLAEDRYPKGLATDDRGNLFVGLTHAESGNNHKLTLSAVRESDMEEISHLTDIVSESGTNIGVNGITVVKQGDRYLCYVAVCYHHFSIRCYDVTDPANISLYAGFGQNGVLETEFSPYYLAADTMGNIYATGTKDGTYSVNKIAANGTLLKQILLNKAYSIVFQEGRLLVGSSAKDGKVTLLDTNLSKLKEFTVSNLSGNLVQSAISDEFVFLSDCGNGEEVGGIAGAVYKAPLSIMEGSKINLVAKKANTTPNIDGNLDDSVWKSGFTTYTDDSIGKPMQFKFTWDNNNLYLAAKMIDDTPFCNTAKVFNGEDGASATAAYSFQYDCLEFYFSGANTIGDYTGDDVQFIFTYQTDGSPALRVGGTGNQPANYANGKYNSVDTACSSTKSGWNFESAIPWTALGVTDLSGVFGISVKQNDDYPEDSNFDLGSYISYGDAQWNVMTGTYTLTLSGDSAQSAQPSVPTSLYAVKANTALKIDGTLDDDVWNDGFLTYTDAATGKPMQIKYAWDNENLYFAAKLVDTTPFFSREKTFADDGKGSIYTFQYDCLEFYFSASNRKGAYGAGDVQMIFTYQNDGKPVMSVGASGSQREDFAAGKFAQVKSACSTTTFGWNLEAAIPWTALSVTELSDTFGLTVKQNDDFIADTALDQGMYISYGDSTWDTLTGNYSLKAVGASGKPEASSSQETSSAESKDSVSSEQPSSVTSSSSQETITTSTPETDTTPQTGGAVAFPIILLLVISLAIAFIVRKRIIKN